jgi:putative protein kinase ArgK-like GTPase of G3E family
MKFSVDAGYGLQVVESVGSGQMDVAFLDLVDVTLYAISPNSGDWLQAMKGGVTHSCDCIVMTKSDLPQAAATLREWRSNSQTPVLSVSAHQLTGIQDLWQSIHDRFRQLQVHVWTISGDDFIQIRRPESYLKGVDANSNGGCGEWPYRNSRLGYKLWR